MRTHQTEQTPNQNERPEPIASERIDDSQSGKTFFLDIFDNRRGRALRLKERSGKVSNVMIPMERVRELAELMLRLADWGDKNP